MAVTIPGSATRRASSPRSRTSGCGRGCGSSRAPLDHVANPGDFHEVRIGPLSVLLVRGDDGELRAFQNACRHRGSALCEGTGLGPDRDPLPVPPLDVRPGRTAARGAVAARVRRRSRPTIPATLGLFPVQVDTWGPLVFVNLAADAEPLADFLGAVPDDCAWARVDEFRCTAAVSIPAPCNWKTLIDGFSETYHVQGIHREMLPMCDDVNGPQQVWDRHGKLAAVVRTPLAAPARPARRSARVGGLRRGDGRTRRERRATRRRSRAGGAAPAGRCAARSPEIVRDAWRRRGSRLVRDARRRPAARHVAVQPLPERHRARVRRHDAGGAGPAGRDRPTTRSWTRSRSTGSRRPTRGRGRSRSTSSSHPTASSRSAWSSTRTSRTSPAASADCTNPASRTSRCRRPRSAAS